MDITGGASTVRQAFAAGVIDELMLDVAPVLLGAGEACSTECRTPAYTRSRRSTPRVRRTSATASAADSLASRQKQI